VTDTSRLLFNGPENAAWTVILAHGAGAGMETPFMESVAAGLGARGLRVVRFEFLYMRRRRETGRKSPPDRAGVLEESWREVLASFEPVRTVIGGKSMGGRIASLIADERGAAGLVCLGYPFHPPGKPEKTRIEHLRAITTPTLILQGTRDPFGKPEEVAGYELSQAVHIVWLEDGDHSFKPRKKSGRTLEENLDAAVGDMAGFVDGLGGGD
jgi:predicted alpha/beta-hydrolase family hydrolase